MRILPLVSQMITESMDIARNEKEMPRNLKFNKSFNFLVVSLSGNFSILAESIPLMFTQSIDEVSVYTANHYVLTDTHAGSQ